MGEFLEGIMRLKADTTGRDKVKTQAIIQEADSLSSKWTERLCRLQEDGRDLHYELSECFEYLAHYASTTDDVVVGMRRAGGSIIEVPQPSNLGSRPLMRREELGSPPVGLP